MLYTCHSFLVNKPSMWSHIGFQQRERHPLTWPPALPYKPTSTSPSPGSVSSVSTHLWIPAEEQKEYYGLYTLGALSERAGECFSLSWRRLRTHVKSSVLCVRPVLVFVFFFFFSLNEQTPLGGRVRAHSNQSQPLWETNASHGDRYAAAHDHLCSFAPVPHLLWERSRSEVSQLSLRHLYLSDKLLQNLPHFTCFHWYSCRQNHVHGGCMHTLLLLKAQG